MSMHAQRWFIQKASILAWMATDKLKCGQAPVRSGMSACHEALQSPEAHAVHERPAGSSSLPDPVP